MAMVMSAFVPLVIASLEEMLKDWRLHGFSPTARDEAQELKKQMKAVEKFLDDAENKRIQDRSVELWLAKLRQAAYETEQVLESFKMEAEVAPRWKIKIAEYVEPLKSGKKNITRLKAIMTDISKSIPSTLTETDKKIEQPRNSTNCADFKYCDSIDVITDVSIGISALVEKLVEDDRLHVQNNTEVDRRHHVLLLAVCGMGGIGKTTVARKIFHDQRIRSAFSNCFWVPVPKSFTQTDVLSATIRAAGGDLKGSETVTERRMLLAKFVRGKRIFLVLNGSTSPKKVHPDREYAKMHSSLIETLHILCAASAEGSRVLMTTRAEDGAVKFVQKDKLLSELLVVQIHRIPRLTVDEGWMLLQKTACLEPPMIIENASEVQITTVKKCNGLPLAVKIVGGVLRQNNCTSEAWKSVCENEAFSFKDLPEGTEGLMGSICLSYQDALPQVKQCLLYLSLFPMDFIIDHHSIIQLWISEGLFDTKDHYYSEMLLASSNAANWENNAETIGSNSSVETAGEYNSCSLEDSVENYFNELLERNLLQQRHDRKGYMMHERVWSFAQYLTKDDVLVGNLKHMDELPANLRRISLINMGLTSIPGDIGRLRSLRTLILSGNPLNDDSTDKIFMNLKFLQVLDLSNTEIKSIPITLGNLVHLRHLDISQTKIKALPESIGRLRRLRFLGMRSCRNLVSLPTNIQKLPKLEYLNLRDTKVPKSPPRLRDSKHLTFLHGFIVVDKPTYEYGWPLEELEHMKKLRSLHLKIEKYFNTDLQVLSNMPNLKSLELCCGIGDSEGLVHQGDSEGSVQQGVESIFKQLHPNRCLQSLKIDGNHRSAYPEWLSATELPNLQQLNLFNCKCISHGSSLTLRQFQNIKFLILSGISNLQKIDMKGSHATPYLEELHIEDMQDLESLSEIDAGGLPLLQKLAIISCPNLKALPGGLQHCKKLTTMEVRKMELLKVVENILSIKELVVESIPQLAKLSNLPLLKVLTVISCTNLEQVMGVNSLRHIHMEDERLVQLPKWLEHLASKIETLDIVGTSEFMRRCERNMEDWYIIREIAHVYAYLPGRLSFFRYTRSNDFFCKHQRQRSHAHNGPSPSPPPAGVDKRRGAGVATSSSTSSRADKNLALQAALAHLVIHGLILQVNINASHRDQFEVFVLFFLFCFSMFSMFKIVRWR